VNELDLVRVVCEELPEPTEGAVARARDALRREIAATSGAPVAGARPRLILVGSFGLAAILAVVVALVLTVDRTSFGVRIAAAASAAVTPASNELVHSISRTTVRITDRAGTTTREQREDDNWWRTTPPVEVHRTTYAADAVTTLTTVCGSISYDANANLFTIQPTTGTFNPVDDPVAAAANALRSGHVHYRGKLRYRGIAAAELVVTQYGATTTYIVRRDNGYPLETIDRRMTSHSTQTAVTTYALFEHVAPTPRVLRHIELTPHPDAFVVRIAPAAHTASCARFGSLETLTGRGHVQ
jgi:hypothetical protein